MLQGVISFCYVVIVHPVGFLFLGLCDVRQLKFQLCRGRTWKAPSSLLPQARILFKVTPVG